MTCKRLETPNIGDLDSKKLFHLQFIAFFFNHICLLPHFLSPSLIISLVASKQNILLRTNRYYAFHVHFLTGANPEPICLEVFGKFAQVCAKFSDLAPTADGLRGCLELTPKLLGESQLEFPIGCFKSTTGGMEMEDPPEE